MFHSTFDAFETFLFVPDKVTTKGSHIRDSIDMKRTMTVVIIILEMWKIEFCWVEEGI